MNQNEQQAMIMLTSDSVLASSLFSTKDKKTLTSRFAKKTGVEVLKLRYRYPVIEFVCGSSTGT